MTTPTPEALALVAEALHETAEGWYPTPQEHAEAMLEARPALRSALAEREALRTALEDVLRLGHIEDDGPSQCQCKVHLRARSALAATPTPAACHGDDCLHCAWEAAVKALPDIDPERELILVWRPEGPCEATTLWTSDVPDGEQRVAGGPTPTAALQALAARLTEGGRS